MSAIKSSFNAAANSYNDYAFLQKEVASRLNDKLKVIATKPKVVLDLGAGTGVFSQKLAERYPDTRIICADFANKSLTKNPLTDKVCANALELPFADNSVDIITSNLMLQWCPELDKVFAQCFRVLKHNGLFLFSTFGPDTLLELKRSWAVVDNNNHVNNFLDMHNIGDTLMHIGFQNPIIEMEQLTLTYAKVVDLMRDLKAIGAQAVLNRAPGLTGKDKFAKMTQTYEAYRKDGKLPASYEVIYGHAWKAKSTTNIAINNK